MTPAGATLPTQALVLEAPGRMPRVETVEVSPPRAGEVLVRITAAGVCRSDLHVVDGEWRRPLPAVLGHEGAGVVEAAGPGVAGLAVGDPVVLTWLPPCGRCRSCRAGRPYVCSGSHAGTHLMPDGTTRLHRADGTPLFQYSALGTLAERVCVSGTSCVRVPLGLAPEVAALIGCGAATGWGSVVNTAEVRPGQAVAVVGCGGVGLSAVMAAAACGAKPLVAVDRVAEKLAAARDLGATHTVLATGDSWWREVRAITDGLDVGLDCIGDPEVVTGLVAASVPGATVVLVGMTAEGVQVPLDGYRVPDAGLRILGSAYGSCVATRDFPRIARLSLDGRLPLHRLVSHRIGLADVPEAFAAMRRGERLRSIVTFA